MSSAFTGVTPHLGWGGIPHLDCLGKVLIDRYMARASRLRRLLVVPSSGPCCTGSYRVAATSCSKLGAGLLFGFMCPPTAATEIRNIATIEIQDNTPTLANRVFCLRASGISWRSLVRRGNVAREVGGRFYHTVGVGSVELRMNIGWRLALSWQRTCTNAPDGVGWPRSDQSAIPPTGRKGRGRPADGKGERPGNPKGRRFMRMR